VSFKARTTAVMLVVLLIVYGWYFATVLLEAASTPVEDIDYQGLLFVMVVILVILFTIGVGVLAALARREANEDEDERDRLIEMRGAQVGSYVLIAGVLAAMGLAMVDGAQFWIAQLLLAGLVLAELAKSAVMLMAYRRGF
jgi:putative copper export protein